MHQDFTNLIKRPLQVCMFNTWVACWNLFFIVFPQSQPTSPHRGWFVPPFGGNPWWVYLASALPALLVTILIFMDQQITAVIVNRKEHKLKVSVTLSAWFEALDRDVGLDTVSAAPSLFFSLAACRAWFVPEGVFAFPTTRCNFAQNRTVRQLTHRCHSRHVGERCFMAVSEHMGFICTSRHRACVCERDGR